MGMATRGKKRTGELLHDILDGRDYEQMKELISDRSECRQVRMYVRNLLVTVED